MGNYQVKVNIEIVESEAEVAATPQEVGPGMFEFNISGAAAESIDACEQALLSTNYPALRSALAHHLESLSKKRLKRQLKQGFGR